MGHRNGAVALESVILASDTPAETAARLSRLAGLPLEPDPAGGYLLALPGAAGAAGPEAPELRTTLRVLPTEALPEVLPGVAAPASPCIAGMVIRTADANASAAALLAAEGIAAIAAIAAPGLWGEGLLVPPEYAGGAALVFAA
jgi:hypothetical protein